jgi:hypothetical protein
MLPFSAFKMFSDLKNIFDSSKKKWLWLTDKEHATGTLKNYCFPFCRPQCVTMSELNSLDFKYLVIGTGQCPGVDTTGHSYVCAKVNGSVVRINTREYDALTSWPNSVNGSVTDSTHDESGDDKSNSSKSSKEGESMVLDLAHNIIQYGNNSDSLKQPLLGDQQAKEVKRSKRRDKNAREVGEKNVNTHPITVYTNVRLTRNMQQLLYRLHQQGEIGEKAWMDDAATDGALQLVEELRAEFRNCDRLVPVNADGHADEPQSKVAEENSNLKIDPENPSTRTSLGFNEQIVGA